MSSYDILQRVIEILSTIENVTVCETYPESQVPMPLSKATIAVDISSGGIAKNVITLTAYMPEKSGSEECRQLVEQAREKLIAASLTGFEDFTAKSVNYEKVAKAYIQQADAIFESPETAKTVNVTFGSETIVAMDDVGLKYGRNLSMYYSPIAGAQVQDLGSNLRIISGTTIPTSSQFSRLSQLVQSGEVRLVKLGTENFNAVLSSLSGLPQSKVKFTFTEVAS